MNWSQCINRLDFNNDCVIYQQIHSITTIKFYPLVYQRKRDFLWSLIPPFNQLVTQTFAVGRFKETWPQVSVNFNRRTYDRFSNFIYFLHIQLFHFLLSLTINNFA